MYINLINQVIQEELERTVNDITSSVSFSPDVFEERAPQLLPYNPNKTIFRLPSGTAPLICSPSISWNVTTLFFVTTASAEASKVNAALFTDHDYGEYRIPRVSWNAFIAAHLL